MSTWRTIALAWDWEPSIVMGCGALLLGYAVAVRFRFSRRAWFYAAGVAVLLLALVSPVDTLGDTYLFSAHMLQHMLLILAVPPLLLSGIPKDVAQRSLAFPTVGKAERVLSKPLLAWTAGIGTMWIWHWPPLYNAALSSQGIHIFEHLSFLVGATIFWWPVISPVEELRLPPLAAVVYTFAACSAHSILAILLTFAPVGYYPAYLHPADALGILPLLRNQWGLTPAVDQQWGGLMMWIPACLVYLTFILATLARWYQIPEPDVPGMTDVSHVPDAPDVITST
ncbi:MAG: cytochrome c oxidase assembly protein [Terriglobia bacterium]